MKVSLEDKNWKEFLVSDIFNFERGKRLTKAKRKSGNTPLVTAGFSNEGVAEYIDNPKQKIYSNSLTIDMFGNVFYREYQFKCDDNIHVLSNKTINKLSGQFLTSCIKTSTSSIYSYGKQFRLKTLQKLKVLLPTTPKGNPDYEFMEAYMRQKEQEKLDKYKQFVSKRLSELQDYKEVEPLEDKEWGEFRIEDVFDVKSGKRLTKADMNKGQKPFIGATDSNNGITEYVSNTNQSEDSNVLGVNYNGSVVENFYHPYTAIFSDDVKRLSFREIEGNKHQFLFVKAQILKQKAKYQYGYKFNAKRMNRQRIMLPMNQNNQPDYEYMENYMKRLEYKKIKQYLDIKK